MAPLCINPYCQDYGWLFEDFKEQFEQVRLPDIKVVSSEDPLPDADAWICIRTDEAAASPDLAKTVVQIHDFWEHPGINGSKKLGALVFTHDEQVNLHDLQWSTRSLVRPIGARRLFTLRESMPAELTVGWVGREIVRRGKPQKRPNLFVDAVRHARQMANGLKIEARMYGPDLQAYAEKIGADLWEGPRNSDLRDFYHSIDLLVVTSEPEPGPLSVWEALACGVPVICGHHAGPFIFNGEITRWIKALGPDRVSFFQERADIRRSMIWWQEDWLEENVRIAASLA
jgi:glycosyltransferase involved in cell wall biosynthesis